MDDHMAGAIGPDGRDDALTRELRALYAAPSDPAYWEGLEARILARIALESDAWWTPFRGWLRSGLVAAAVALFVAGLALFRSQQAEVRIAAETVVFTPQTLAQQIATQSGPLPDREATLRYVISP